MNGNTRFWFAVLVAAAYWPVALYLEREITFDIVNSLTVAFSVGVLVNFYPALTRAVREVFAGRGRGNHFLMIGVNIWAVGILTRHIWNWAWRWYGRPDYWVDHPLLGFLVYVMVMGAAVLLRARDLVEELPPHSLKRLAIYIALGLSVAFLFIIFLDYPRQDGMEVPLDLR